MFCDFVWWPLGKVLPRRAKKKSAEKKYVVECEREVGCSRTMNVSDDHLKVGVAPKLL